MIMQYFKYSWNRPRLARNQAKNLSIYIVNVTLVLAKNIISKIIITFS